MLSFCSVPVGMPESAPFHIQRLGAQGDGIVERDQRIEYVPFALPGERWVQRNDGAFQRLTDAPERIEPACAHFEACGGCVAQHMGDALYEQWKIGHVRQALSQHGINCEVSRLWRAPTGSRRRVALSADLSDRVPRIGYRAANSHQLVPIEQCVVAEPRIAATIPLLTELLGIVSLDAARESANSDARIQVLLADNGLDVAIHSAFGDLSAVQRQKLAHLADTGGLLRLRWGASEIFQRAQPVVLIAGAEVAVSADMFVQAVAAAQERMAQLAGKALAQSKHVADLFCGLGAFSLPLAKRSRVLAVDNDQEAISSLERAVRHAQGLKPIKTLSRDLFREPLSRGELNQFDGVLFDPPRAGAAAQTEALAKSKVPVVVAVSCNPATLARDLRTLVDGGYKLASINPIDQFLYSTHVEAVAVLRR